MNSDGHQSARAEAAAITFSIWLAGGGTRGGQAYGATDELGYHAVENRVQVADLHATLLHLLGLDYNQVSYNLHGRDEKLPDVY